MSSDKDKSLKNIAKLVGEIGLAYLAIGGVLGDIGTSPLYVMSLTFKALPVTVANVMGVLSLIFWSFMFLSAKYAWMALELDNNGEGGTFALLSLIRQAGSRLKINMEDNGRKIKMLLSLAAFLSMLCGALLLSDGVITPSISVLAAVEGVGVRYPNLSEYIIPIAVIILTGLFLVQKRGTEKIAGLFSPIIIVWFVTIGALGAMSLRTKLWLLKSVSPLYAIQFLHNHPIAVIFPILGYVVLCITGGEALYADEAHYGKFGIRAAWFVGAICLLLNYFGQGAYLLSHKVHVNPFYGLGLSASHLVYIYLLVIATLAAIIASQAMITGGFSTYKQAMELRMFPRVRIINTSPRTRGQIYIPAVNRGMFIACITTVFLFRSSSALGDAYGLAVTGAFIGTTMMMGILFFLRNYFQRRRFWMLVPLLLIFMVFDTAFFSSNLGKIPTGGWFPMVISIFLITTMLAWEKGSSLVYKNVPKANRSDFVRALKNSIITVLPGTDIHMTGNEKVVPASLLEQVEMGVLRENIILVTVKNTNEPWGINYNKQVLTNLPEGQGRVWQVLIEKGYMRLMVNVPKILEEMEILYPPYKFIFGLWSPVIVEQGWRRWFLLYFRFIYQNAPSLTRRFGILPSKVRYIGGEVELSFSEPSSVSYVDD